MSKLTGLVLASVMIFSVSVHAEGADETGGTAPAPETTASVPPFSITVFTTDTTPAPAETPATRTSTANVFAPRLVKSGSELVLIRPLDNGAQSLKFTTLGRELARAVVAPDYDAFSEADRATMIESLVYNWSLMNQSGQIQIGLLYQEFAALRGWVKFDDLVGPAYLKERFRNLYLLLRLVSTHRRLATEEDNAPLRTIFAMTAYGEIRNILEHRDLMKEYPDESQILEALVRLRDETPGDTSPEWIALSSWLSGRLTDSLESELKRRLHGMRLREEGVAAAATALTVFGGAIYLGDYLQVLPNEAKLLFTPAFVGGPALAALAVSAWKSWNMPARLARARAKVDDYVTRCHERLLR